MLAFVFALFIGMIIGAVIRGAGIKAKDYDADVAEILLRDATDGILVRDLADKTYPEQPNLHNRIVALRLDLAMDGTAISAQHTDHERRRLADACTCILTAPHSPSPYKGEGRGEISPALTANAMTEQVYP